MGHSRTAELYFLDRLDLYKTEKLYQCLFPVEGGDPTNIRLSPCSVPVMDMRAVPASTRSALCVDTAGFEWLHMDPRSDADLLPISVEARAAYCRDIENLVKSRLGAAEAFTFSTVVRIAGQAPDQAKAISFKLPIRGVHADFAEGTCRSRKDVILEQSAELGLVSRDKLASLQGRRYRFINTWRPLMPVAGWPLALCDFRSLDPEGDVEEADVVYSNHVEGAVQTYFNTNQEWYYIDEQTPEDLIIFQTFDSQGGPFVCHGSFPITPVADGAADDEEARQSIETRLLVID